MPKPIIARIVRNLLTSLAPYVADTTKPIEFSNQEAILREKRLARKEMLESEAFKKALPSVQMQMLRTLDN